MKIDLPQAYYTASYIAFGVAFVVLFLVPELIAAFFDPDAGDTLTEHIRPWIQSHGLLVWATGGAISWLFIHFLIERG